MIQGSYVLIEQLTKQVSRLDDAVREEEALNACRALGNIREHVADLAVNLSQDAYRAGASKTKIAFALGVPPGWLSELRR